MKLPIVTITDMHPTDLYSNQRKHMIGLKVFLHPGHCKIRKVGTETWLQGYMKICEEDHTIHTPTQYKKQQYFRTNLGKTWQFCCMRFDVPCEDLDALCGEFRKKEPNTEAFYLIRPEAKEFSDIQKQTLYSYGGSPFNDDNTLSYKFNAYGENIPIPQINVDETIMVEAKKIRE